MFRSYYCNPLSILSREALILSGICMFYIYVYFSVFILYGSNCFDWSGYYILGAGNIYWNQGSLEAIASLASNKAACLYMLFYVIYSKSKIWMELKINKNRVPNEFHVIFYINWSLEYAKNKYWVKSNNKDFGQIIMKMKIVLPKFTYISIVHV